MKNCCHPSAYATPGSASLSAPIFSRAWRPHISHHTVPDLEITSDLEFLPHQTCVMEKKNYQSYVFSRNSCCYNPPQSSSHTAPAAVTFILCVFSTIMFISHSPFQVGLFSLFLLAILLTFQHHAKLFHNSLLSHLKLEQFGTGL